MSEPIAQESSPEPVQEPKKGRTLEEKMGRVKWTGVLLNRTLDEIQQLRKELAERDHKIWEEFKQQRVTQRAILQGFRGAGLIKYTPPMLQRIAVKDAVDLAILDRVFQVGAPGLLPRDVAQDPSLSKYGLKHYHVSRRIVRMNKRLLEELSECLFEKRGHKWALTSFGFDVWGEI